MLPRTFLSRETSCYRTETVWTWIGKTVASNGATAIASLERSLSLNTYHPRIYARAEEFYESPYEKWSTTALYAGSTLPLGRRLDLSPYYCHQNNTGKKPNQQQNQLGLIANFYFSLKKK